MGVENYKLKDFNQLLGTGGDVDVLSCQYLTCDCMFALKCYIQCSIEQLQGCISVRVLLTLFSILCNACRDFLVLFNNTSSGIFWVCSFECLLSTTIPESQDSVWGPFSKIMGCAKAVLGVRAVQLSSRSDQNHCRTDSDGRSDRDVESEAVQLKLLRQHTKIDPLFEDSEDMQTIFTKGGMKSSLDGRPSAFSDSTKGPVCLFLFVDCSSWPNLTAACAAQVAKQGLRHGYTFWRARCRFQNRGLVTILVHLYLYNLIYITTLPE